MTTGTMLEFVVIVEAEADFKIATELAERVFQEKGPEWLADYFKHLFTWSGLENSTLFSCWRDIRKIEQATKSVGYHLPRFLGHTTSGPGQADAASARKVMNLCRALQKKRNIGALVLIRDIDHQAERRTGLEQARAGQNPDLLTIAIGTANPKREAWVLNGFRPESSFEQQRLDEIRQALTFNPCTEAHQLRSMQDDTPVQRTRNIKIVLEQLTQGSADRERRCWTETDLTALMTLGRETGLSDYLQEVEEHLLGLLTERNLADGSHH